MGEKLKTIAKKAWGICTKRENLYTLATLVLMVVFVTGCPDFVFAREDNTGLSNVTANFTNLQNIVAAVVSSMGSIITLWGISEWGLSLQGGNGGMMEAQGFKRIMGGIVMILGTNILAILTTSSTY
ncbi:MAG: hypothetical protein J6B26_03900 [Agathobacter sp.]|nr:hypothetical protein [Agathobacter sp.]